jgi:hypothetical protein
VDRLAAGAGVGPQRRLPRGGRSRRCRIHGDADLPAVPFGAGKFRPARGQRAAGARLGRLAVGFPAVDAVLGSSKAKLFLLCHPHNPTGRVWNEDELWQLALLAEKHDLVMCSDEIHNGLVLSPYHRHRLFATLSPEWRRAPSP